MNSFFQGIVKDKTLLLIIAGLAIPIVFLLLLLLLAVLQMDTLAKGVGSLFAVFMYIFAAAIVLAIVYIPFFKKTSHGKTKTTKILIFLWLLISAVVMVFLGARYSLSLSDFSVNNLSGEAIFIAGLLFLVGIPFLVLNLVLGKVGGSTKRVIIYSTVSAIVFSFITGMIVYIQKPATLKVDYPFTFAHYGDSYSCQGLLTQSITSDNGEISKKKGIVAESTTKSNDTIAISIDNNELAFVTAADIQAGDTKGRPLPIIENSDKYLVAVDRDESALAKPMDVFTLNKKTGIALWSRSIEGSFIASDDPDSETEYLICR